MNKNEFMNKVMSIIEGGLLPDIMEFPNGLINYTNKFNNIIYYNENIEYIKSIKKDCELFENNTLGTFILCNYLESMLIIKEEILRQIKKDKRTTFNLITTGSSCDKIMDLLLKNPDFEACINNICIYCMNLDKYQYLKEKYQKIHDDIFNKPKDVINFIKKYSDVNIKPFPITKLITYQEYQNKYKDRHIKICQFYGNLDLESYEKNFNKISTLITEESQNKELKKDKDKLLNSFRAFNINSTNTNKINLIKENESNYSEENFDYLDKLLIKEYTNNYLYKDLNKWLLNYNKKFYESIAYFTGRLMFSLNSYAKKNKKYFTKNKTTLYRGIKIPYSCLLPYERAKGKIIILTSFTSASESKSKVIKFSGRNQSVELYKTNKLFSVIFYIKNLWKKNWISNGINVQEESQYNEKEILFQPYSFYFVSDVKINLNRYTADIYLETVGKTIILEEEIKKGKEIIYNEIKKVIDIRDKN